MPTLKQVRRRITSVKNTMQITKAMKMVAAAKLRKASDNIIAARPYADKMQEMVRNLAMRAGEDLKHPLLSVREIKNTHIVMMSGDRGLCGAFNANLTKLGVQAVKRFKEQGQEVNLTAVGRKGFEFFKKRNYNIVKNYMNLGSGADFDVASVIARDLIDSYTDSAFDQVILIYSEFHSPMVQRPKEQVLLPIAPTTKKEEPSELLSEYIFEPSAKELLEDLLPRFVEIQVYRAILDNLASEFGARMTAMDNATNNASDMIDTLTLQYNRARQSAITKELMDIVGGAEALLK